jgi:hypothetical protein
VVEDLEDVGIDKTTKEGGSNMPNRDRTGPAGMGPMTGGGFGLCNSGYRSANINYGRPVFRRGGRGGNWGQGNQWRRRVFDQYAYENNAVNYSTMDLENRLASLEDAISDLKQSINSNNIGNSKEDKS